jgi:phospholipid N-methyltransferase
VERAAIGAPGLRALLRERLVFYRELLRATSEIGAFFFTAPAVARAVAEPLQAYPSPRRVLEVGAGTGVLTRALVKSLGPLDRLDLYEINPRFARLLRDEFSKSSGPRVEIFESDIETLPRDARYDVIVSSLPFLNFPPEKVRRILELFDASLAPGGAISSWDYWGHEVRAPFGARVRKVLRVMREFRRSHECRRRIVVRNFPPACVQYLTGKSRPGERYSNGRQKSGDLRV